ncbi:cysteine synthase A [Vibrio crassostreae]|uniref:cysteine synthase A n=1 Tax=Vibrio crassostreae TaxID=246167 RepID=UPI002E1977CB|nr:cysteine synthase A [Vibrio crassostreae]
MSNSNASNSGTPKTIFDDNSFTIGNTPLVRLNTIGNGRIYAKIESRNPSFSVKCRIGSNMIWKAEKQGLLKKGVELIEPTSGNTGIALAMVAASRGHKISLVMPETMSIERRQLMRALGATLILTEGSLGMKGAFDKALKMTVDEPGKYLMLDQFSNPANPAIHEETTGPEIWTSTGGDFDFFIAGVGTGGTITGVSRYIKNTQGKALVSIAVEPTESPVLTQTLNNEPLLTAPHKIQGIGAGFIPRNLDMTLIDEVHTVSSDEAINMAKKLMSQEGILAGISSGAVAVVANHIALDPQNRNKNIVVVFPSASERYISTELFERV